MSAFLQYLTYPATDTETENVRASLKELQCTFKVWMKC